MAKRNTGPRLAFNKGRNVWEIRWTEAPNSRSRRRSTGTANREEAELVFADWLRAGGVRGAQGSKPAEVTVQDCLDDYLTGHARPHTTDGGRLDPMHRWLSQVLGPLRVADMVEADTQWYVMLRRDGAVGTRAAKDGTIRRELGHLVAALNYAVRQKRLTADAVPHIPKPDDSPPREDWLTEGEVDALLDALEDDCRGKRMSRTYRFVVLALATGARKGAIESLRWQDVDFRTGLIRYDRQVIRKTKKRKVAVPIAEWLQPYLTRMANERTATEAGSEWVLDHPGCVRAEYEWAMRRVAKATSHDRFVVLTRHALRHTCATLMLRAGVSLWQVAGVLGDTVNVVEKIYGHHAKDKLKDATNSWRKVG